MKQPIALKELRDNTLFQRGDVFVLFGELFGRGYATGLIDAARAAGMTVIGITVGRRDETGKLNPLTPEELQQAEENLGGRIINIPLMAGFDMDSDPGKPNPTEMLGEMTLENWQEFKLDWDGIERSREVGTARFTTALKQVMDELAGMIPAGRNVLFAHTMAGGIPRAKAFLAIANRVYKGRGARYMSSDALIESDLGKLILWNFDEVTANSFGHLLAHSAAIREKVEASGGQVRYSAYGYHGTRVLIDGDYRWQTYTNYTQGYAKMRLERLAQEAWEKGIKATVFNCPEIRTNSSDVFAGIELSLLPLLTSLKKEGGGPWVDALWDKCQGLLQDGVSLESVLEMVRAYQLDPALSPYYDFTEWPKANSAEQVDKTVGTSQEIGALHKDRKELISDVLSSHVVDATGKMIFGGLSEPQGPVVWLDHDKVAQQMIATANKG
ncbi:enoyl ACP reductase FabMG family protein [Thioclava sp. FR2]|uniref:enoyl ACP reductase FabMG family protein n=1 Tax=Thioclava sp. FR2 TaxID=3445780 RepID=UPI003EBF8955